MVTFVIVMIRAVPCRSVPFRLVSLRFVSFCPLQCSSIPFRLQYPREKKRERAACMAARGSFIP